MKMKFSTSSIRLWLIIILALTPSLVFTQKVGFISSQVVREHFIEAKQAEQRVQSLVEEWKRELNAIQQEIESLEFEVKKNRLVWSDDERLEKEKQLEDLKQTRLSVARSKFEADGEYDQMVKAIMRPIEDKIYAAIQQVAADEGFDIIWDQSTQPMPYLNFKYDLTVKVLRKLGVNVDELEKELKDKIDKDPRNKQAKSYQPRKRSRDRRIKNDKPDEEREIERKEPVNMADPKNMVPPDSTK